MLDVLSVNICPHCPDTIFHVFVVSIYVLQLHFVVLSLWYIYSVSALSFIQSTGQLSLHTSINCCKCNLLSICQYDRYIYGGIFVYKILGVNFGNYLLAVVVKPSYTTGTTYTAQRQATVPKVQTVQVTTAPANYVYTAGASSQSVSTYNPATTYQSVTTATTPTYSGKLLLSGNSVFK